MKRQLPLEFIMILASIWLSTWLSMSAANAEQWLEINGVPRCVLLLGERATEADRAAVDELEYHLGRAFGAKVPFVEKDDAARLPKDIVRIIVGDGKASVAARLDIATLKPEQFRIKTAGNRLLFVAHPRWADEPITAENPPAILFATSHFLDRFLEVRWLWPGELGTFVPKRKSLAIPDLDITYQPELERRRLRLHHAKARRTAEVTRLMNDVQFTDFQQEGVQWCYRHMMGTRTSFKFGHAFGPWWKRFSKSRPDYFATPPPGRKQPYPLPSRVKLCVSNPAVTEQIVQDWIAAGKPDNWNVCPNDGRAFCTCRLCRALDGRSDQSLATVWYGSEAVLTGRYVTLWNGLLRRMRAINPKVTLSTYAYSNYREPRPGEQLEEGIVLGIVDVHYSSEEWEAWHRAGARLFLRPNWWHTAAVAPHLPLSREGDFFRFARTNRMVGFDFDSLFGHWATQGPLYYLTARLAVRPEMTVEAVLDEYCSAFGPAALAVRDYLEFWELHAERCAYDNPNVGLFAQTCLRQGISPNLLVGSHLVLPYLYNDDVLNRAEEILNKASRLAKGDPEASARVAFLRDGLVHLRANRDVIAMAYDGGRLRKPMPKRLPDAIDRLMRLRAEMTPRHVVWGELLNLVEIQRHIAINPSRK